METQELREFVALYSSELADLTFNSKPIINTLTMLASENVPAASSIAAAIEKHLFLCPPEHKLFALYLLDSIVKNIGAPYVSLFARNLPEVYMAVWAAAPSQRGALQKLLNTWKGLFPDAMLAAIAGRTAAALAQPLLPPTASPGAVHPVQAYALDPRAASYPAPLAQQPYLGYGPPPSPPAVHAGSYAVPMQQQQQQYYQAAPAPQQYAHPAASIGPAQLVYHAPPQQQPQQQQAPPPVQQSQAATSGQQQQQQAAAVALPGFLSSLYQAGLIQMPGGAIVAAAGDPLEGLTAEDLPLRHVNRAKLDFDPDRLKAHDGGAIRELLACSAALRPKHLDAAFLHRRRTRAGAGRASQLWYVGLDDWVAGTAADAAAAPAFFDMQPKEEAAKEAASVPADDAQPACALSGERFETFWDDGREEWRYRDAVRLDAAQAARYGLAEGVIVKVGCLSEEGAVGGLLEEEQPGSIAQAGHAAQRVAADMAAAVAAPAAAAAAAESEAAAAAAAPAAEQPAATAAPAQASGGAGATTVAEVASDVEVKAEDMQQGAAGPGPDVALGAKTADAVKREAEEPAQLGNVRKRVKVEPR